MIWSRGELIPDDGLTIGASDRTFEHGLGLFETMRTWGGRAALLASHRSRMLRSAEVLGLPIDPDAFPNDRAVDRLLRADGSGQDRMLRVTATGGSDSSSSVIWMRSAPLPAPLRLGGLSVDLGSWSVSSGDPMARHKSLNYWSRRLAFQAAQARGFDEALGLIDGDSFGEGSRSNLFLIEGDVLMTPSLDWPIVPGVMRGLVLELTRSDARMDVREGGRIDEHRLRSSDALFLTNAVRGIMPVALAWGLAPDRSTIRLGVSPWLDRLREMVDRRLTGKGDER